MGILDPVERFNRATGRLEIDHVGCADLLHRIRDLNHLQLHVFGHIHLGYGTHTDGQLTSVNASMCTEQYRPTNSPIVVNLT